MPRLNVNPTRMELLKLKQRLVVAKRGHKLLKDKSDEMIRQFVVYIKQNRELRTETEKEIEEILRDFIVVRSRMTSQEIENSLTVSEPIYNFVAGSVNVMGLNVPKININEIKGLDVLPYSIVSNSSSLDSNIIALSALTNKIINLAEIEKTCTMLADDIERNRRRINALEYILIPNIEETMKYIVMKLDENERNNIVRLMKVKQNMS